MKEIKKVACPICAKLSTWTNENAFRPFCSERCKLIDLGEWADETYRVTGEKIKPEQAADENEDQ